MAYPFNTTEQVNINEVLDATYKEYENMGESEWLDIQDAPILEWFDKSAKNVTGAMVDQKYNVSAGRTVTIQNITYDDVMSFNNPTGGHTSTAVFSNYVGGIQVSHQELLEQGLRVSDNNTMVGSIENAKVIRDKMQEKLTDLHESMRDKLTTDLWDDGTNNPTGIVGLRHYIVDDPTANISVGGINQVSVPSWRNHARLNLSASDAEGFIQTFHSLFLQLRRYARSPKHMICVGSDFMNALHGVLLSKGYYTQTGFSRDFNLEMGDITMGGATFKYDPYLDSAGLEKRCYVIDKKAFLPKKLSGEWMRRHGTQRPIDQFVYHTAVNARGTLLCKNRNSSAVLSIA